MDGKIIVYSWLFKVLTLKDEPYEYLKSILLKVNKKIASDLSTNLELR